MEYLGDSRSKRIGTNGDDDDDDDEGDGSINDYLFIK